MYAYFLKNYFSKVGTQIFHAIGIPVGSDPASFFANLVLFHYESEWTCKMENIYHHRAKKIGRIYRFINDLIAMPRKPPKSHLRGFHIKNW